MKKLLFLAAAVLIGLQACDKSDDDSDRGYVSEQAKQALAAKYPNASGVEWEVKNKYVVAEFSIPSARELSAWFDNNGTWYMTETDITFDQLPEAVKTSFSTSQYAAWRVEDVDQIERNTTETIYVVEVENQQTEVDLQYAPNGVLIQATVDVDADDDYEDFIPVGLPVAIDSYLKTNYPDAKVLDVDIEGRYTEVDILDGQVTRELIFDSNYAWISTKTELRVADVPATITHVLSASPYAAYRIDEVDFYQTPASDYYRFELESATDEVTVNITTEGVLTVVGHDTAIGA